MDEVEAALSLRILDLAQRLDGGFLTAVHRARLLVELRELVAARDRLRAVRAAG